MKTQTRTTDGSALNLDASDPSFEASSPRRLALRSPRRRIRLRLMTGRDSSFTVDASAKGVCTERMRVLPVGTRVEGYIHIDGQDAPFVGRVAWSRSGDSRLNQLGRMGVCFDRIDPVFAVALSRRDA
jgi:hypothetical protein